MIIVVTGPVGTGKSTVLEWVAKILRSRVKSLGGVISRRIIREGERNGYELVCVADGSVFPMAKTTVADNARPGSDIVRYGSFDFDVQALHLGNQAILEGLDHDYLFIDEIGFWDLKDGGWSRYLGRLKERSSPTIIGMRLDAVDAIVEKWDLEIQHVYDLSRYGIHSVTEHILGRL